MYFAKRLKTLREQRHMTQEELARQLNITRQAVGNYEQGTRFPKDEQILKAIADLFDIPMDDLFGRRFQKEPYSDLETSLINEMLLESPGAYETDKVMALKELIRCVKNLPLETIDKITEVIDLLKK